MLLSEHLFLSFLTNSFPFVSFILISLSSLKTLLLFSFLSHYVLPNRYFIPSPFNSSLHPSLLPCRHLGRRQFQIYSIYVYSLLLTVNFYQYPMTLLCRRNLRRDRYRNIGKMSVIEKLRILGSSFASYHGIPSQILVSPYLHSISAHTLLFLYLYFFMHSLAKFESNLAMDRKRSINMYI